MKEGSSDEEEDRNKNATPPPITSKTNNPAPPINNNFNEFGVFLGLSGSTDFAWFFGFSIAKAFSPSRKKGFQPVITRRFWAYLPFCNGHAKAVVSDFFFSRLN
jgi:hypothetical protein